MRHKSSNKIINKTIFSGINKEKAEQGITRIKVEGFKSLYERSSIEVRLLTILAGANSSGKSSIMQPFMSESTVKLWKKFTK